MSERAATRALAHLRPLAPLAALRRIRQHDPCSDSSTNLTAPAIVYTFWGDPVIHVYRFSGALLLFLWLWGALLLLWRRARVNVVFLLSHDESTAYTSDEPVCAIVMQ